MNSEEATNPYESPQCVDATAEQTAADILASCQDAKRRQLLGMIITFAVSGFVSGWVDDLALSRFIDLATGLVFAFLILRWCDNDHYERQQNQEPLWHGMPWRYFAFMMILCPGPLIMMPIYLLVTRGWRGFISIAWAGAFFALLVAVCAVAAVASDPELITSLYELTEP